MEDITVTDQDYNLWVLLGQVSHTIGKLRQKELKQYGITGRNAIVLKVILAIGDNAIPVEISRWLLRERHTISALLRRMEKDGLVRLSKDLGRSNLLRVTLTEKGRTAYYESQKLQSIHKMMSYLSEEQRQQLGSCLHILLDAALKELGVKHKVLFPPL